MSLFINFCTGCKKRIDTYATDRHGTLPTVFCGSPCETAFNRNKTLVDNKEVASFRKVQTQDQLTEKLSSIPWSKYQPNGS